MSFKRMGRVRLDGVARIDSAAVVPARVERGITLNIPQILPDGTIAQPQRRRKILLPQIPRSWLSAIRCRA